MHTQGTTSMLKHSQPKLVLDALLLCQQMQVIKPHQGATHVFAVSMSQKQTVILENTNKMK